MWGYHGSKMMLARHYPAPKFDFVIEPFAGSAGYALAYRHLNVLLCDLNPDIIKIWKLIQANELLEKRLPLVLVPGSKIKDLKVDDEVRLFLSYKACCHHSYSRHTVSQRGALSWPAKRKNILQQAASIKHWMFMVGSFSDIPDWYQATWFVDPPYQKVGVGHYPFEKIDYKLLRNHCTNRWRGQVIACEQKGADWLPFDDLKQINSQTAYGAKPTMEMIWTKGA